MARLMLLTLLLVPGVALADPITLVAGLAPIIGGTAAAFLVSYGGYIAFGLVQLAGAASARRKQRAAAARQRAATIASLQDRNVTVLSTEEPWRIAYGSPAPIGGALQAILTSGANDEYQHLVIVYNCRPSQSIDEVYIEGVPVGALDGSGWVTGGAFYEAQADASTSELVTFDGSGVGTVSRTVVSLLGVFFRTGGADDGGTIEYPATASGTTITAPTAAGLSVWVSYTHAYGIARVNVQKHLSPGGVDTADAFLMAAVPDKWTSAHKASGMTYLVVTLDLRFGAFQGGPPNITARGQWSLLYDYRTSTTAYSANCALVAADFLRADYGFAATSGQIDTAAAMAAANDCDAQGFEAHGLISTGSSRDSNLQQIEDAMAGASHFSGGVWRIMAGAWSTPVLTLNDAHLAGPIEVVQGSNPSAERYNTVRGQYVPASGLGTSPDYTPYVVDAYLAVDGKEKVHDLPQPMVATNAQCQKLAAIAVERSRLGETINYPAHLVAWKLQPGDRVTVNNTELGYVGKTFRMTDWSFSLTAPVGLVLTEDTAAVYTGTFTDPDAEDPTGNLGDPFARPAAPANLVASSGNDVLQRASDGTVITRVLVTWQATDVRTILQAGYTQLQWRLATEAADVWQSMDLPADASSQYLTGLPDGTALLIRVHHISGLGVPGIFSTVAHLVLGKTEAPPDVDSLAINGLVLSWPPVDVIDLAGYRLRAVAGATVNWAAGFALHEGVVTDPPYTLVASLGGLYTYMVVAVDTSGNESTTPASVTATSSYTLAGNTLESWPQAPLFEGAIVGGTVVAGQLVADTTGALFWGADTNLHWANDAATYWGATSYGQMTYTFAVGPSAPGLLVLDSAITGNVVNIDMRRGVAAGFWTNDAANFWTSDPANFWTAITSAWAPWPGALEVVAGEYIELRVTTNAGATQGVVSRLTPYLDVPTIEDYVDNAVVAAVGTRLTLSKSFRVVKNIQLTVQQDGGSAVTARWIDKLATGPLVQALDVSGNPVPATVDAYLKGY